MSILVLGLCLIPVSRAAAQDDAKAIVTKAIAAAGGAEKLEKYKASKSSSKGTITIMGMELEFTAQSTFQAPDKFKNTFKLEINGQAQTIEQKFVGDKAVMTFGGMTIDIPDAQKAELKTAVTLQRVMSLTSLLSDKGYELKVLASIKADDKELVGVAVNGNGLKDVKLFFDASTHLLAKIERMGLDPMGTTEVKQETSYSDYKEYNGVKKPTKVVMLHDGKKFMESNMTELTLLEKLDDKEFSD